MSWRDQVKNGLRTLHIPAMILLAANAYAAKAAPCVDPGLTWEMRATYDADGLPYTSRIKDDRTGTASRTYVNGSEGVSATLNFCNGTGDALLSPGSRKITLDFGPNLAPSGTTISPMTGAPLLNVRDLLFPAGDRSTEYEFTTWLGSVIPAAKGAQWSLRMFSTTSDFVGGGATADNLMLINTPNQTAKVRAHHCPATSTPPAVAQCAGVTRETWFVYPDPTANPSFRNVAALVNVANSGLIRLGQFEMPFYFVISIK
jgi:hypothetical protein